MVAINQRQIIINSTILFVVASTLAMTLHELGHFFALIMVNAKAIAIHHNYVSNDSTGLSLQGMLFVKAAGPFVSIVVGMLFHFICSRQTKRNLLFLFNLYMSAFGYIGFFGYLMMAPLFTGGDTGYICYALGFSIWMKIIVGLGGVAILWYLMKVLARYFVEMGSKEIVERKETRKVFTHSLLLYPIFIGIILTTPLNLPIKAVLSLIAPICSPFSFFWGYKDVLTKDYPMDNANKEFESLGKFHSWVFIALALTIIMNRLLVAGISVG